jgi:hypothetical protein
MVCSVCGLDADRLRLLESENIALQGEVSALRRQLDALSAARKPTAAVSFRGSAVERTSSEEDSSSQEDAPDSRRDDLTYSPLRGFTAAGIAEAEAAEEVSHTELVVKVADAPRRCHDVVGACTVVHVRTFDRPGLLASLSAVLGGMDLYVARATLDTSSHGLVTNEFWVRLPLILSLSEISQPIALSLSLTAAQACDQLDDFCSDHLASHRISNLPSHRRCSSVASRASCREAAGSARGKALMSAVRCSRGSSGAPSSSG